MYRFKGFDSIRAYIRAFSSIILLFIGFNGLQAQPGCVMTCGNPLEYPLELPCNDVTLTINDVDFTSPGCTGPYTVHLEDENDQNIGKIINASMIGETFHYVVTSSEGNPCWGDITIVDGTAPAFTCPPAISINCLMSVDMVPVLTMNDIDDCSDVTIDYNDVYDANFPCNSNISAEVTRTYTVTDEYGNVNNSCQQIITIENVAIQALEFPENLVLGDALSCDMYNIDPQNTGYPSILMDGMRKEIRNNPFCNIGVDYDDSSEFPCDGAIKIFRTWSVWDNCVQNSLVQQTQIIEIKDDIKPVVTAPKDMTVDAYEIGCFANVLLPDVTVQDLCSNTLEVTVQGPFPIIEGFGGYVEGLPLGEHIITYTAVDDCGNDESDQMRVHVKDLTPPNPVCKTGDVVALNNFGEARVPAYAFNLASYDECAGVYFKVKRMSSDPECEDPENVNDQFNDDILFCCSDIQFGPTGEPLPVMIILRVYDRHPVEGPVTNEHLEDRFDDCMIEVFIQDNIEPEMVCPIDMTIDCHADISDLKVFGEADATDNCELNRIMETPDIDLDQCNTGTITRLFTVSDQFGNESSCTQTIRVKNLVPFDGANIDMLEWPEDFKIEGCGASAGPDISGEPLINEDACALVGVSRHDSVLEIADTACYKVERIWSVIDWCQFDTSLSDPYTEDNGFWTKTQYVLVIDTSGPVFEPYLDITLNNFDPGCDDIFADLEEFEVTDCTPENEIVFHYKIDIGSNGEYERFGFSNAIREMLPKGIHKAVMTADDKCGNESRDTINITVKDLKSPSIVVLDGLAVELMPMGPGQSMVEIIASWFDAGSYDNCSDPGKLYFSFSSDPLDSVRMFTCADIGTFDIDIWVTDEDGNSSFATTTLSIQDNAGNCALLVQTRQISGTITDEHSLFLDGTHIGLYRDDEMIKESEIIEGKYLFDGIHVSNSLLLMPVKQDDPARGLSTLDILLIQQHILGLRLLDSPYKRMAADVNHSGTITAADLVEMKKVLLQVQQNYSSDLSWGFTDMNMEMDEENTMQVDLFEGTEISPSSGDLEIDFVGYKLGDVNESIVGADFYASSTRSPAILYLNPVVDANRWSLKLEENEELTGFQMQLELGENMPPIKSVYSHYLDLKPSDYYLVTKDDKSYLNISWTNEKAIFLSKANDLFTIEFEGDLGAESQLLSLNSEYLKAEAYNSNMLISTFQFRNRDELNSPEFSLAQNRPNPWSNSTIINYSIPRDQNISISIWDVTGMKIFEYSMFKEKGEHNFTINHNKNLSPGLYFYQLKGTEGRITKRMIIER